VLVVLDTGIFVSAAITPAGIARRVVQAGVEGQFDYVVCPTLLADVLARPKISRTSWSAAIPICSTFPSHRCRSPVSASSSCRS
jgi:predicted nucleic acid-binding protein